MKKLQFKFDGSEDAKKCIEWVNENCEGRHEGVAKVYYNNEGYYSFEPYSQHTLLTPTEFLREVTGENELKKVVCVDAKGKNLTEGKEYFIVNESNSCYDLKNDSGELWSYDKNCFRSSPTFQYGQEVEVIGYGKTGRYIAKAPDMALDNHIIQTRQGNQWELNYYSLSDIRPIPTLKQKIVEVLFKYDMPHSEIADKIIEMVKGGSDD